MSEIIQFRRFACTLTAEAHEKLNAAGGETVKGIHTDRKFRILPGGKLLPDGQWEHEVKPDNGP